MILYTIISEEDIFCSPYDAVQNDNSKAKRIKSGYGQIKKHDGGYKTEPVFSTDPSIYLRILGEYDKP